MSAVSALIIIINPLYIYISSSLCVAQYVSMIVEWAVNAYLNLIAEQQLHNRISDVIAIGISRHTSAKELLQIATDSLHVLQVPDASDLSQFQSQLVKTICS